MERKIEDNLDELNQLIQDLQVEDLWTQFAAAYKLQARAIELGEFAQTLQEITSNKHSGVRYKAAWLLKSLGNETTERWGHRSLSIICPSCVANFCAYEVQLSRDTMLDFGDYDNTVVYYACSNCGKSREFLDTEGSIAVLDNQMKVRYTQNDGTVRVNWLMLRQLLYFSAIEIIRASDEEVERFVVQLGNDTVEERKARNKETRCLVASDCELSENTRRILGHFFGGVELVEGVSKRSAI